MRAILIEPARAADNWHVLKSYIERALEHSVQETPLHEWLRRILNYQAQLWATIDDNELILGVGITQFLDYSTHRTLHIVAVSGSDFIQHLTDAHLVLEKFA